MATSTQVGGASYDASARMDSGLTTVQRKVSIMCQLIKDFYSCI